MAAPPLGLFPGQAGVQPRGRQLSGLPRRGGQGVSGECGRYFDTTPKAAIRRGATRYRSCPGALFDPLGGCSMGCIPSIAGGSVGRRIRLGSSILTEMLWMNSRTYGHAL